MDRLSVRSFSERRGKQVSFSDDVRRQNYSISLSHGRLSEMFFQRVYKSPLLYVPIHLMRYANFPSTMPAGNMTSPRFKRKKDGDTKRKGTDAFSPRSHKSNRKAKQTTESGKNFPTSQPNTERKLPKGKPCQCINGFIGKDPSDTESPDITSIASLPDGSVVVVDRQNHKMKLFGSDFVFLHAVDIPEKSWGVTNVYVSEVAITCGNTIKFFEIRRRNIVKSSKELKLDFEGTCFGICFNRGRYAITCGDSANTVSHVCILDKSGKELSVIKLANLGNDLQIADTIAIDGYEDRIYVALKEIKTICCVGFSQSKASIIWKEPIKMNPNGILLKNHNLYVFGHDKENDEHNIDILSPNGWFKGHLLTKADAAIYPKCLGYLIQSQCFVLVSSEDSRISIISLV